MQHSNDGDSYFIDQENAEEMVRLNRQGHAIAKSMGGKLFPTNVQIPQIHTILDIACGPGGWGLDVAEQYPEIQLKGIDISERMIEYAQFQARERNLSNAHFLLMNALEPFSFPDASFDIVNGRFLVGFMKREAWPVLFQECLRILRPGGLLSLTESDTSTVLGSPATSQYNDIIAQAMWKFGQGFDSTGRTIGITPMLSTFFEEAGFQDLHLSASVIDCSYGSQAHDDVIQNFLASFRLLHKYLLSSRLFTQEQLDSSYKQVEQETASSSFRELWYIINVIGTKPS